MGHQNDGLGAVVNGIFDCGQGTDNSLVVGDFHSGVKGDVEIDLLPGL